MPDKVFASLKIKWNRFMFKTNAFYTFVEPKENEKTWQKLLHTI